MKKTGIDHYKLDFNDRSCRTDNRKRKKDYYKDNVEGDYDLFMDQMGYESYHFFVEFIESKNLRNEFRSFLQSYLDDYVKDHDIQPDEEQ